MARKLTAPILLVDTPEKNADLRYASGFWAPDPVVFLHTPRGAFLVVSMLEQGRAMALAKQRGRLQVVTPEALGLQGRRRRSLGEWAAALLQREGIRRVVVPPSFPLGTTRRLESRGVRVVVAKAPLYPERARKRPEELEKIVESQRAAVAGMRAAIRMLRAATIGPNGTLRQGRQPLTSEQVKLCIQETLLAQGTFCRDVIVACGPQGADPHERGHGPLRAGQPIVIDIFPQHLEHGYWGDLTRTLVKGKPSPALRKLYRTVRQAQQAALDTVKAGVPVARVHAAVVEAIARAGYETRVVDGRPEGFIHSTGHGVGLDIHEAPSVAPVDGTLKAGEVITIEPGLYYPELGGIRIEDTVCVTREGHRLLAACPHLFDVK
jgi:Xaa-Pro aminopeptidase